MSSREPRPPTSRREQAVARSLGTARLRAERRVQRFLDAALDLMAESPDKEFTVQEVVDRSGQSLRSFYQHFAGKQDLVMAVFTETVRATADALRKEVAGIDDPSERLHRLTIEYHRRCRPARPGAGLGSALPALADVAQQLLLGQPGAASQAFLPLKDLFDEALAAAGLVRGDGLVTGVMLQTIMFHTFAATISGSRRPEPDAAEALWELILNGIGTPAGVG